MADRQGAVSASADEVMDALVIEVDERPSDPGAKDSEPVFIASVEEAKDAEAPRADGGGEVLDAELVEEDGGFSAESRASASASARGAGARGAAADSDAVKTGGRGHVKKRRVARSSRKKRGRGARRVVPLCMALLVAAALVAAGLFCWQKWLRFDDAADIQGSWQVQADGESIVFDARDMKITKGISYEYRLDTGAKTISYQFGNLAGAGHYYFSADRRTLVILENGYQAGLLAEAGFLSEDLLGRAGEDGVIVLVKLSDDTDADPSGTATGITGATTGEREYVGQQASASSSSQAKSSSSSGASSNASHAASTDADGGVDGGSGRGFVDADGDGYDDASGMDYEGFMAQRDASDADSTDGGENGATDGGS